MKCRVCDFSWTYGNQKKVIRRCPVCENDFLEHPEMILCDHTKEFLIYAKMKYNSLIYNNPEILPNLYEDMCLQRDRRFMDLCSIKGGKRLLRAFIHDEWYVKIKLMKLYYRFPNESFIYLKDIMDVYLGNCSVKESDLSDGQDFLQYAKTCKRADYQKIALEKAVAGGNADGEAYYLLGLCYLKGIGTQIDCELARKYLVKADDKGVDSGMRLHDLFLLDENIAAADYYLRKQVARKNPEAMYLHGIHLIYGDRGVHNKAEGVRLLQEVEEMGYEKAKKKMNYLRLSAL